MIAHWVYLFLCCSLFASRLAQGQLPQNIAGYTITDSDKNAVLGRRDNVPICTYAKSGKKVSVIIYQVPGSYDAAWVQDQLYKEIDSLQYDLQLKVDRGSIADYRVPIKKPVHTNVSDGNDTIKINGYKAVAAVKNRRNDISIITVYMWYVGDKITWIQNTVSESQMDSVNVSDFSREFIKYLASLSPAQHTVPSDLFDRILQGVALTVDQNNKLLELQDNFLKQMKTFRENPAIAGDQKKFTTASRQLLLKRIEDTRAILTPEQRVRYDKNFAPFKEKIYTSKFEIRTDSL